MKVLTEGHLYELSNFENKEAEGQKLQFIEKVSAKALVEKKTIEDNPSFNETTIVTVNDGTTNEEVIEVLIDRLTYLQLKFPCKENACAITHLQEANMWLYERTRKRLAQNVEGKNINHKS